MPVNLKVFSELKEFLMEENDKLSSVGSLIMFSFPAEPQNAFDEVYPGVFLMNIIVQKNNKVSVSHIRRAACVEK